MKTIQEWADFLNKKIACFKINDTYKYLIMDLNYFPYSSSWSQFTQQMENMDSYEFHDKYHQEVADILAKEKYDSVFIPDVNGNVKMLVTNNNDEKYFISGSIVLPYKVCIEEAIPDPLEWDSKIYMPLSDPIDIGEHQIMMYV